MVTAHEDVVDSLVGQHQQLKTLFIQVGTATGEHRAVLFTELVALLSVHESIEERFVHPLAERELDGGAGIARSRTAEEEEAARMLGKVYALGTDSADFPAALAALRDAVIEHALAEEEQEFLRLRTAATEQELTELVAITAAAPALAASLPPGPPADVLAAAREAVSAATVPSLQEVRS